MEMGAKFVRASKVQHYGLDYSKHLDGTFNACKQAFFILQIDEELYKRTGWLQQLDFGQGKHDKNFLQ